MPIRASAPPQQLVARVRPAGPLLDVRADGPGLRAPKARPVRAVDAVLKRELDETPVHGEKRSARPSCQHEVEHVIARRAQADRHGKHLWAEVFNGNELVTLTLKVGWGEDNLIHLYSPKDDNKIIVDFKDVDSSVKNIKTYSPLTAELLRKRFQCEKLKKELNGQ